MKILCIADEESPYFWEHYKPGRLDGVDLILSAGDLKSEYLSFLVTMGRAPLLYVHGNHDGFYEKFPPEGCDCIDGEYVNVNGLKILGLGGSMLYNHGPHQYSEKQMRRRIRKLRRKIRRGGGIDIFVTHAPVRGYGDREDPAHLGFECFKDLIDEFHPRYMLHGHVHLSYSGAKGREHYRGETKIINACGYTYLEV